jgi:hypothetical protein
VAVIYIALGDKNEPFWWLQKSYEDRSEHMLYLKVEPLVDPLRKDPRFDSLVQRGFSCPVYSELTASVETPAAAQRGTGFRAARVYRRKNKARVCAL